MQDTGSIIKKTASLAKPIVTGLGFTLVDVEYVKEDGEYYLRIFIDKPGGVTIDDCVAVTHPMNEELDKEDFIDTAYIFEVSSPGGREPNHAL